MTSQVVTTPNSPRSHLYPATLVIVLHKTISNPTTIRMILSPPFRVVVQGPVTQLGLARVTTASHL